MQNQSPRALHFEKDEFVAYRDWLDRLPVTQPIQAGELMYKFLRYLFQADLPPSELYKTLEYSQAVLKFLWHGLRKYYLGISPTPYVDKGHIIYLVDALEDLTADHYVCLIKTQSNGATKIPEVHGIFVQRAMYHLTHQILNHYQLSSVPPKGVWLKLNRLYLHAKKYKLLDQKILFNPPLPDIDTSIRDTYLQALLIAGCDPYQLRYSELEHLYQALFAWVKMAKISDDGEKCEKCAFIMNVEKDLPPHYKAFDQDTEEGKYIGVDTTKVSQHLRDILTQTADDKLTSNIIGFMGERLLLYLSRTWSSPYNRKFPRWDEEGQVQVIVGFDAVYQNL